MQDYKNLKVWQKAHALGLAIYRQSARFPADEQFGLTRQLRRAVVSIAANIAEGCFRSSDADFGRFLHIALGSAGETEYLLILSHDLGYLRYGTFTDMRHRVGEVKRMLSVLVRKVRAQATET